jgi:hypothetical protein
MHLVLNSDCASRLTFCASAKNQFMFHKLNQRVFPRLYHHPANQMQARFIILTHFSQRYPKIPVFPPSAGPNVGIAFDNMMIKFSWFKSLASLLPAFQQIFIELESSELQQETQPQDSKKRKQPSQNLPKSKKRPPNVNTQ